MWDITTGRLRLGLAAGDVSRDSDITLAMSQALALAEKYCDRYFLYKATETRFYWVDGYRFQLARYPLETVNPIKEGSFTVHQEGGWIKFGHPIVSKELKIVYAGGYKVLPADLELALWNTFDSTYGAVTAGAIATGGLKKVSITGVGSLDYDTGSAASTNAGGAFGGLLPAPAQLILDLYRREYA